MKYSSILRRLKNYSIIIDKNQMITSVSSNISSSNIGNSLLSLHLRDLFSEKYMFDDVEPTPENISSLTLDLDNILSSVFDNKYYHNHVIKKIMVNKEIFHYSFIINITLMDGVTPFIYIEIKNFEKLSVNAEFYEKYFDYFVDEFELVQKMNKIGKFLIDFEKSKYLVYGNDVIPELLHIDSTEDNLYVLNSRHSKTKNKNTIIRSQQFYARSDMLIHGEIEVLHDEWQIGDRWLKLEAKVIQRSEMGETKVIGGIVYDITDYHKYRDLEHVHSIYELAITSGGIGIFHYNLDKHDNNIFEANKIYANMIGLDPIFEDFYSVDDFFKAQLVIEDEITNYDDVKVQIGKLFSGEITGTTDDILKIKNLKTGEIRYLLSSSKIDSYYDDGTAKRFGGIIIDITDRINKEKNQREFAYKDELTSLGNNRLLHKDLQERHSGIGLFFDLDNFKKINDMFGHIKGDQMIQTFGKCLSKTAKEYEFVTVYRLYGDEFFVFGEYKNENFAYEFEEKVTACIAIEMENVEENIVLAASMGHSYFEEGSNIDDFIKYADYSMYKAKIKKKE
ncbi:MAG: GGDEF domain-containing protein [Bacilli bacterium]|nr:GGDEF domain-containing protein [Bacilli bacterium]